MTVNKKALNTLCIDRLNGTWAVTRKFSILLKYEDGEYSSCLVNVGALQVLKLHCRCNDTISAPHVNCSCKSLAHNFGCKICLSFQTFERLACIMNESSVRRLWIPWRFANPLPIHCVTECNNLRQVQLASEQAWGPRR